MSDPWAALRAQRDSKVRIDQAKKIDRMHLAHGTTEGRACGDCKHLYRHQGDYAGHYFKCHQYGYTNGPGTDWRLKWAACGLFEQRGAEVAAGVGSGREQTP